MLSARKPHSRPAVGRARPFATYQPTLPLVTQTIVFPATATASSWDHGADRGRNKSPGPMMQMDFILQTSPCSFRLGERDPCTVLDWLTIKRTDRKHLLQSFGLVMPRNSSWRALVMVGALRVEKGCVSFAIHSTEKSLSGSLSKCRRRGGTRLRTSTRPS